MMARKREGLGERHIKILEILEDYQVNKGYPPTIREIGEEADISSTSVVNYYLKQLEEDGYIERKGKISRGLQLIKNAAGELLEDAVAKSATIAAKATFWIPKFIIQYPFIYSFILYFVTFIFLGHHQTSMQAQWLPKPYKSIRHIINNL